MPQVNNNNKKFYNIIGGKISRKVDANAPGAVSRVNKKNETVYELQYDSMDGFICNIEHKESDFGIQLIIDIDEDGDVGQLQIPLDSKYSSTFIARLGALDPVKKTRFLPYDFKDKDNGKRKMGLALYQGGNKIQPNITKDNPYPNQPQFPSNTKDEIAMATYNVSMRGIQINHLNTLKDKFKRLTPNEKLVDPLDVANALGNPQFNEDDVPF